MNLKAATIHRRAELLAQQLPKSSLHPAVLQWVEQSVRRGPWLISLSGGADSMALLFLVWMHWPDRRSRLRVVHYNHRLRGRASDGDEKFCRDICRILRVPISVGRRRITTKINSEAQARKLRFEFIDRVMRKFGSKTIWLGHQQDDVAETMLMRLARGSGAGGLAAPRPIQSMPLHRVHLRPLLNLKCSEIEAGMRLAQLPWRVDASNMTGLYFRNRIRHDVIPTWVEAAERDAVAGAARSRDLLDEDDSALDDWAVSLYDMMPAGRLSLHELGNVPRAVVRRLLHRWLMGQEEAGDLSRQAFVHLLEAVMRGESTRQSIGTKGFAVIKRQVLSFELSRKLPASKAKR